MLPLESQAQGNASRMSLGAGIARTYCQIVKKIQNYFIFHWTLVKHELGLAVVSLDCVHNSVCRSDVAIAENSRTNLVCTKKQEI